MCNYKDQNANKIYNFKFKVLSSETSNVEFHFPKL